MLITHKYLYEIGQHIHICNLCSTPFFGSYRECECRNPWVCPNCGEVHAYQGKLNFEGKKSFNGDPRIEFERIK